MRRVASAPSFSIVPPERKAIWEGEIHVVTPMFGGSATAGQVDPGRPVNAKMVRGHLRFWWRALQAPRFSSQTGKAAVESLFRDEARLWGALLERDATPSMVDVVVRVTNHGSEFRCNDQTAPAYVLFPFRQASPPQNGLKDVSFRLELTWSGCNPATLGSEKMAILEGQVTSALHAWLLFGGVGARTRRGCGTLCVPGLRVEDMLGNVKRELNRHLPLGEEPAAEQASRAAATAAEGLSLVPSLSGARLLMGGSKRRPVEAWCDAIAPLVSFRQGADVGRTSARGRSRWPEADAIREKLRGRTQASVRSFPRADLGMPIVFHFPREFRDGITLAPAAGKGRMASPIILKALADSRSSAVPIALTLHAPHVWEVAQLDVQIQGKQVPANELDCRSVYNRIEPLNRYRTGDPREAFMAFFKQKTNAKEVKL